MSERWNNRGIRNTGLKMPRDKEVHHREAKRYSTSSLATTTRLLPLDPT
jgi:hypothetical protein